MAVIKREGFDKYGPVGSRTSNTSGQTPTSPIALMLQGPWTSLSGTPSYFMNIAAGLSGIGTALQFQTTTLNGLTFSSTLPASYARAIGGIRFNFNLNTTFGITFALNGTGECGIHFNTTGTFSVHNGTFGGANLATSAASVSANTTHYLAWDIIIGNPGSFTLYLDGVQILTGTGNTGAGGQYNQFQFQCNGAVFILLDDLVLLDTSGTTNNTVAPLLTSPRIETQFPISDLQKQFTNGGASLGENYGVTTGTNAPGANELYLVKVTPPTSMTLASISTIPAATSATAKLKAVVYPDSGGSPTGQALTAVGAEVVGTTSGAELNSAFVTPPVLAANTPYWIGFITDTSVALNNADNITAGIKAVNTYASGAPATCPTMTTGQANWRIWGLCTAPAANFASVELNPPPGLESFVFSSTAGQTDLYRFAALTNPSAIIFDAAVSGYLSNSDTGARTANLVMSSAGSQSSGSNPGLAPATSFTWLVSDFPLDPNGNVTWLPAALNAAAAGAAVAS